MAATAPTAATTTTDPVRWGVLSTANIGKNALIPAIRAARNARFVAIGSRDAARAAPIVAQDDGVTVHGSYEALLDDPDVEAIYIPLPNELHVEWTIRALEHGKHVLCEKPLGLTVAEVRAMFAASQQAGKLLMEAFMYRFHPQVVWALEQIHAGRIGEVRLVRSGFHFDIGARPGDVRLLASLGGGALVDVGVYPLNFSRAVYGQAPVDASARVVMPVGYEVDMMTAATLDFGNGRLSQIDCSFMLPDHRFAEVWGARGYVYLPNPFAPGASEAIVYMEIDGQMQEQRFTPTNQYQLQVEHFSDAIRTGQPLALSPEDALAQVESVELIYRAAGFTWPIW